MEYLKKIMEGTFQGTFILFVPVEYRGQVWTNSSTIPLGTQKKLYSAANWIG